MSEQSPGDTPERRKKWTQWSDWVVSVLERRLAEAKAHGLETNCLFYCCDETPTNRFPGIDAMLAKFKPRFPQVPFATTAYDTTFGTGKHLKQMDIFIPQTIRFDPEIAAKSRAQRQSAAHGRTWPFHAAYRPHGNPCEARSRRAS